MRLLSVFSSIILIFYSAVAFSQIQITDIRLWQQADAETLRLVLDLNAPVVYKIFTLKSPHRVVIDLNNTQWFRRAIQIPSEQTLLTKIRSAPRDVSDLRIVLDLSAAVTKKSFLLNPSGGNGHRLVVDIKGPGLKKIKPVAPKRAPAPVKQQEIVKKISQPEIKLTPVEEKNTLPPKKESIPPVVLTQEEPAAPVKKHEPAPVEEKKATVLEKESMVSAPKKPTLSIKKESEPLKPIKSYHEPVLAGKRDIVVVLDAGHGGIDPGAIGQAGIQEKDIVLAIAEDLVILLKQTPGIRPVLTRKGDYFLPLRKRVELARKYKADLLVSIHADAYPDKTAQGSSVYILSRRGASSEAVKWLAERENNADLIGGVSLNDKDDLLASVLFDLSQTSTLTVSAHIGQQVLDSLKEISKNHYRYLQRAGFIVLRAPDVPSILVEVGFISNPEEEQLLNDTLHRLRVAQAIAVGIKNYFAENTPLDSLVARR